MTSRHGHNADLAVFHLSERNGHSTFPAEFPQWSTPKYARTDNQTTEVSRRSLLPEITPRSTYRACAVSSRDVYANALPSSTRSVSVHFKSHLALSIAWRGNTSASFVIVSHRMWRHVASAGIMRITEVSKSGEKMVRRTSWRQYFWLAQRSRKKMHLSHGGCYDNWDRRSGWIRLFPRGVRISFIYKSQESPGA